MLAKLAMVDPSHERADRMMGLFSPAAHRRGQLVLLGFGDLDTDGSALPLALFGLGQDNPHRGGSPAAPLALRLFVEAVLAVGLNDRRTDKPVALQVTLRDLLDRLYPGPRKPRPTNTGRDSCGPPRPWTRWTPGFRGLRPTPDAGSCGAW